MRLIDNWSKVVAPAEKMLTFKEKPEIVFEEGYTIRDGSSLTLSSTRIQEVKKAIVHQIKDGR